MFNSSILFDANKFTVMIIGEDKDKDLHQLEKFVKHPDLHGYITHMWYGALRSRYPYDFILYAKKHNRTSEGYQRLLDIAAERVNELYAAINSYLIDPPKTEEQKVEFERIIAVFEKLLRKQNAEN
jgi:hypothetical protein